MSSDQSKHSKVFLVTTAMEEFWDTSLPIVFMGEWCRRYARRLVWGPLRGEVLAHPWMEEESFLQVSKYIDKLYNILLCSLSSNLNKIHKLNNSIGFWRIIIGPWLRFYITVIYHRYVGIQKAIEKHQECTTIVLAEKSNVVPNDTLEFIQLVYDDPYNLQIYSNLMRRMGFNFPEKEICHTSDEHLRGRRKSSLFVSLINGVIRDVARMSGILRKDRFVALHHTYFTRSISLKLFLRTFGAIITIYENSACEVKQRIDTTMRCKLGGLILGGNEFEAILAAMLPHDMPVVFLEAFESVNKQVANQYPYKPGVVASADSWFYDEVFKHWVAWCAERGTKLLGLQHGGNYGSLYSPAVDYEVTITDKFYTWGWTSETYGDKVIPASAPKLCGRKVVGADNGKRGILYVTTAVSRYMFQFPFMPETFIEYLEWNFRFIKFIRDDLRKLVRARMYQLDFGWDITQRWTDNCPEITLDDWKIPFSTTLKNCRLYVCDHLGTTFLEALSARIPTILFWDPNTNKILPEAQPYYDFLKELGILHYDPESAAEAVNRVYDDVEDWWGDPKRQGAVTDFCNRFARHPSFYYDEWLSNFKNNLVNTTH